MPPPYPPPVNPADFTDRLDETSVGQPPEARVARFAASLGREHHNTLVPSSYGIVYLQAGTGSVWSKSFGGTEQKEGQEDFHYAPGVEDLTIKYRVHDPKGVILSAFLEIYRRFDSSPLWRRELTEAERADGEHSFKLELGEGPFEAFPDAVPTAEHSPYKLKLTTSAEVRPQSPCAWTFFQVLVHDVTLELGDKKTLPADGTPSGGIAPGSHRSLYDTLGGNLPAAGSKKKIELLGNLFKASSAEMYSNAGFDHHKTQWGDGPLIPIFAKLRLRKSDNTPAEAPLGLGNVKCLWDWEDVAESTSGMAGPPALFVLRSVNYDRGLTKPNGDNCHKDRGGKRSADGSSTPVFPSQSGYAPEAALRDAAFPFKVKPATTRTWAALSSPWRTGILAGKTGGLFRPSRMSGDVYKLGCYVAWEKDKDGKLVLDILEGIRDKTSLRALTGEFQIWRRHILSRYVKKKAFAMNIPVAKVQAYYQKAYVELEKDFGATETMAAGTYNTAVQGAVAGLNSVTRPMVDPAVNQHATGDCCVNFRSHNDYLNAVRAAKGWTVAQMNAWLAGPGAAVSTSAGYEDFCDSIGMRVLEAVCDTQLPGRDGVTLCQFIDVHNIGGGGGLNGYAADLPSATRQRVAFITCATPSSYSGNANRLEQTTAHEIGHHLFMPHSPDGVPGTAGPAPDMHDKDDQNCTMSYNYVAERRWCGFCTLRLRGWDKNALDKDGTKNTHP